MSNCVCVVLVTNNLFLRRITHCYCSFYCRCHMVYDWHTLLACDNATIPLDQVDKCSFKRPDFFGISQQPIDLRHFGLSQNVVGGSALSVNPCGAGTTGHCNGTMCAKVDDDKWGSLGHVTSASLNLNNDEVVVQVGGGGSGDVPCPGHQGINRTAEIKFVCDTSLTTCTGKEGWVHQL